jgi:hypothetical protein
MSTIKAKFPNKDIAFTAVQSPKGDDFYVLAVVVKDEQGYSPLPWQLARGTEKEMRDHADGLNDLGLHLTRDQAMMFIASSMRSVRS